MAAKKSKQYPYQWSDGTWHSNTQAQHEQNQIKAGFTPQKPPSGSYDPDLDAQELAAKASLGDLRQDIDPETGRLSARAQDDLSIALKGLGTQRTRAGEDYKTATSETGRGFDRSLADLIKGRTREGEDYGTSLTNLSRQYQQLGDAQTQSARAAGAMTGSGAAIQAARKRAANELIDKAPIDLAHSRYGEDSTLGESRLGEDRKSATDALDLAYKRSGEDIGGQEKAAGLAFDRQADDWKVQLRRAVQQGDDFSLAIGNQRQYQYGGPQLYTPPPKGTTGADVVSGPGALGGATDSLIAGPNAPRQPGAIRTKKKKGRTVTYGTSVTTA
jgi:hypothetical protein